MIISGASPYLLVINKFQIIDIETIKKQHGSGESQQTYAAL